MQRFLFVLVLVAMAWAISASLGHAQCTKPDYEEKWGVPLPTPANAQKKYEYEACKKAETLKRTGADVLRNTLQDVLNLEDGPIEQRQLTGERLENAHEASLAFNSFQPNPYLIAYDPSNQALAEAQRTELEAVALRLTEQSALTSNEVLTFGRALYPFLHTLAQLQEEPNQIIIMPGERRTVSFAAYCMDKTTPAPKRGEKLQLVSSARLIQDHGHGIYDALMGYSAQHPKQHSEVQNLLWGMRHADAERPFITKLASRQEQLLDAAMPDGANAYRDYLRRQKWSGQIDRKKQKIYNGLLEYVESTLGRPLPSPSQDGYSPSSVREAIDMLTRMEPLGGDVVENSEYTQLADGVAARAHDASGRANLVTLEIANGSCEPFVFDASEWAGQSVRVTQRLALGGVVHAADPEQLATDIEAQLGLLGTPLDGDLKLLKDALVNPVADAGVGTTGLQRYYIALMAALADAFVPESAAGYAAGYASGGLTRAGKVV